MGSADDDAHPVILMSYLISLTGSSVAVKIAGSFGAARVVASSCGAANIVGEVAHTSLATIKGNYSFFCDCINDRNPLTLGWC